MNTHIIEHFLNEDYFLTVLVQLVRIFNDN